MNFHDKTVLVAGGTGGLGREVTLAFLAAGSRVIATYRREEELVSLAAAAKAIGSAPPKGIPLDVTDQAATEKAISEIVARTGRIDVLVNAVGGYAGGENIWEVNAKIYDQMLQLNLKAGFVLAHAVVPVMIRQNRGWIVSVCSRAAVDHAAGSALYAASKAAALALFDSLAAEVKPYNINVNSVLPSIMDTKANRQAMPKADFSNWPKTEEVARVILFLCSEEARLIHGAAVPVYGRT
jgi:NAD(P)-dependent dehydrogenase (short-subunit alcohol dehydrogenase family)